MIKVRRAVPADAPELVRLRTIMLSEMAGEPVPPGEWAAPAEQMLRERLAEPAGTARLAAFVVDPPDGAPGLASCAIGTIERRLGGPENPTGEFGYLFNVATDPAYRRRGFSRAGTEAVLAWFRERGVVRADLKATPIGEPLYRSLGFVDSSAPSLKLVLPD
ncbi:GNAT family N-acetyltransferase [Natronosporangium hydrolyticum]|uniref:GNAT family N-acetyltransferase n=1 Tax=Natronosporangium hydrolyticum TaxID=2811111 RepID=A0A895YQZ1_9ACTN|nr:GNAT family N-acetyltransferase [Natronosporangium hydrolyticum]QSB16428.1 GNAT family N-acetyltransferase [Natronosporangium hydrolyticum]